MGDKFSRRDKFRKEKKGADEGGPLEGDDVRGEGRRPRSEGRGGRGGRGPPPSSGGPPPNPPPMKMLAKRGDMPPAPPA